LITLLKIHFSYEVTILVIEIKFYFTTLDRNSKWNKVSLELEKK
jgi:hypothetical protein